MSDNRISRRHFFYGTLLAGAIPAIGFGRVPSLKFLGYQSPNEKLNIAGIGAGGQAFSDLRMCETENIVALADVDWKRGEPGFQRYEKAAKYKDYRQMLDKEGKNIDAVLIAIPDHNHTVAVWNCLQRGKAVYIEKPLTRLASEARFLYRAAQKYPVATQMGNQGYSHEATRVACEILWSGEIGEVTEVHAWQGLPDFPQGMKKVPPPTPVPDTLDWDLWLGTAAPRPFTAGDKEYENFVTALYAGRRGGRAAAPAAAAGAAAGEPARGAVQPPAAARGGFGGNEDRGFYLPYNWRGFYDFASTRIGDWGIHVLGPANWGLQLSPQSLISVECIKKDELPPFTFPNAITIKYEFAARGKMPPVTVYWYQCSGDPYLPTGMTAEQARKIPGTGPQIAGTARGFAPGGGAARGRDAARGGAQAGRPAGAGAPGAGAARGGAVPPRMPQGSGYDCIFVGSKGFMGTSGRGEGVGLLPGERWADYTLPPQFLTRSPGHQRDWIRACKGGSPACSNFSIAAPYTEWLLLGSAAVRVEGKLLYDAKTGLFTNNRAANNFLEMNYRKGWEVKL